MKSIKDSLDKLKRKLRRKRRGNDSFDVVRKSLSTPQRIETTLNAVTNLLVEKKQFSIEEYEQAFVESAQLLVPNLDEQINLVEGIEKNPALKKALGISQ